MGICPKKVRPVERVVRGLGTDGRCRVLRLTIEQIQWLDKNNWLIDKRATNVQ